MEKKYRKKLISIILGGLLFSVPGNATGFDHCQNSDNASFTTSDSESSKSLVIKRPPGRQEIPNGRPQEAPSQGGANQKGQSTTKGGNSSQFHKQNSSGNGKPQNSSGGIKVESRYSSKVLYDLNNEYILLGEFSTNLKIRNNSFIALTHDTVADQVNLIIDGVKRFSADDIILHYYNFDNPSDMSYFYIKGDEYYANIGGRREGPYEMIDFYCYNMPKMYLCTDQDIRYLRDSDGKLYKRDLYSGERGKKPLTITSTNGMHKMEISDGYRKIDIDGNTRLLPLGNDVMNADITGFYLDYFADDGTAYFSVYYNIPGHGGERADIRVSPTGAVRMASEEYNEAFENAMEKDHRKSSIATTDEIKEDMAEYYTEEQFNLAMTDPAERHSFESHWDWDYVMVDNNRIRCTAPFFAFYDEKQNAFAWVSQERNKLVMHTFALE